MGHNGWTVSIHINSIKATENDCFSAPDQGRKTMKSVSCGTFYFRNIWKITVVFIAILLFFSQFAFSSDIDRKLAVTTNSTDKLDAALSGFELSISSNPDGAAIYIDGLKTAISPFKCNLKPGMVSIRLEKSGYQISEQKIKLGRNQRLHFEMQPEAKNRNKQEAEKRTLSPGEEPGLRTARDKKPPIISLADGIDESTVDQKQIILNGKAVDDSGISHLQINGKGVSIDSTGGFQQTVQLNDGKNVIQISALDKAGNKSFTSIVIHRQASPASGEPPPFKELSNWYKTQYALIIGIDRYKRNDIVRLKNAVNDAKSVAEMMKSQGFIVTELYNDKATRLNILKEYSAIHEKSKESDSFLFYFAGHGQGIAINSQEKLGYLIPYDADISLTDMNLIQYDNSAINLNQLNHYAKNMKAKHVALLLDSCFSGLAMNRSIPSADKSDHEYYEDLLSRKAINVLTAGDNQPVSDGTEHSPFTQAIINAIGKKGLDLHDRDGYATFNQLAIYVKEKVEKATSRKQRPQFDNFSIEDGDFLFKIR
jgi:hypothetical protein